MSASIEVVGVKDAIRSLNKLEPGLRKKFAEEATTIAQPAILEAQNRYGDAGWGQTRAHGVSRKWAGNAVGGRQVLPFSLQKARNGIKVRLEGDRRKTASILIEQRDAGTAILESAGRVNPSTPLARPLGFIKPRTSRVLGKAVFSKKKEIEQRMYEASLKIVNRVQSELN